ncbi:MAG: hypothetical protein OXF07_08065 [Rhodobacter sp.]|nr:hypothetical protein [Rhodobacter sp.]
MLASVVIGGLAPPLAEAFRPFVVPVSVVMVVISMLRVDLAGLLGAFRRPVFLAFACGVILLVLPAATALTCFALAAPFWLATGLTYAAAAPPLSSAAAFAVLVRTDPARVTAISLPATIIAPFTVWLVTTSLPGLGSGVALLPLVTRLVAIILGALAFALLVRRLLGEDRVAGWAEGFDITTVLLVAAMGIGVMYDIGLTLRSNPLQWLGILAATALLSWISMGLAIALFWRAGREAAMAAGLCASVKNMAVMVAAVLGTVDPRISLIVITAQFPIFVSPLIMRPLFARLAPP